jgi:hypothetical protein
MKKIRIIIYLTVWIYTVGCALNKEKVITPNAHVILDIISIKVSEMKSDGVGNHIRTPVHIQLYNKSPFLIGFSAPTLGGIMHMARLFDRNGQEWQFVKREYEIYWGLDPVPEILLAPYVKTNMVVEIISKGKSLSLVNEKTTDEIHNQKYEGPYYYRIIDIVDSVDRNGKYDGGRVLVEGTGKVFLK